MWQINADKHIPIQTIKCHPGCLCCACENKSDDDSIKKQFSDTVWCFQKNGKCVDIKRDIKRVVYREDII